MPTPIPALAPWLMPEWVTAVGEAELDDCVEDTAEEVEDVLVMNVVAEDEEEVDEVEALVEVVVVSTMLN